MTATLRLLGGGIGRITPRGSRPLPRAAWAPRLALRNRPRPRRQSLVRPRRDPDADRPGDRPNHAAAVKSPNSSPASPRDADVTHLTAGPDGKSGSPTTRTTRRSAESRRPTRSPSSRESRTRDSRSSTARLQGPKAISGSAPTTDGRGGTDLAGGDDPRGSPRASTAAPNTSARS